MHFEETWPRRPCYEMKDVRVEPEFESWRDAARELLRAGVRPEDVLFVEAGLDNALLPNVSDSMSIASESGTTPRVPREFIELAEAVACHTASDHWQILYRALWRLTHGEPNLLKVETDDDVRRLRVMEKQVRFDAHKMKAFVRFREVKEDDGRQCFVAWHRSEHRVLKRTAPFFVRRFGAMRWSILTQFDSAHWDGHGLTFGPGMPRDAAPPEDEMESLWRTYYASIFNPARIKLRAMHKEMPRRYWATMPETQLIPQLLAEAPKRAKEMLGRNGGAFDGAAAYLPTTISLPTLREAVQTCRGCDICERATQAVFGEGPADARVVFVGEQPGDQEDLQGRPFVGPAGQVFDRALAQVGIDRSQVYITNAVKHFKFEPRGQRRIHSKPNAREMAACLPWLESELTLIKPAMLVLLGSTAAQSLIGRHFRITRDRGRAMESRWAAWTIATYHPSALLRIPDQAMKAQAEAEFVADLRQVAQELERITPSPR
jgi:probable DNA metabolism protein